MKFPIATKCSRRDSAQSLVEIALTLPFLLLLLLGVVDLGRMYYTYVTVANAAREGARYGAGHPCGSATETTVRDKATAEATAAGITLASIDITYPDGSCTNGKAIQVTTTSNFQLLTASIFGGGTIPIRSSTEFQLYYGS